VLEYSTQVEDDQLVFPQAAACGARMRQGGALAEGHDGLKCRAAGPCAPHAELKLRCQLKFADAGLDKGQNLFEDSASQKRRTFHQGNFSGVFYRAKALNQTVRR
jgi:hypothetical protein